MPNTLDGIVAIDLTQNVAGPYCTQLLGDFGATIIKIERPGSGDDSRRYAPAWRGGEAEPDDSTAFLAYNRNKKSVCVDLDHPAGVEVVRRLAASAAAFGPSVKPATARATR